MYLDSTNLQPTALREIEKSVGMCYPQSAAALLGDLARLMLVHGFRESFPNACLLLSAQEVADARKTMPSTLLPFMRVLENQGPDFYAFDLNDARGWRIVVWADHAIVEEWTTFADFLGFLRGFLQ